MPQSKVPNFSNHVKDMRGQQYGRLSVYEFSHSEKCNGGARAIWKCKCQCGNVKNISGDALRSGHTKSCGCLHRDCARQLNFKHGHRTVDATSSEYIAWENMRARCGNPKRPDYKNYGGRGITVCDRWRGSFPNFYADMGPKPSPVHSIDRINNDGNYDPDNCRWATRSQQRRNSRSLLMTDEDIAKGHDLRLQGKTYKEIGEILGFGKTTILRHKSKA